MTIDHPNCSYFNENQHAYALDTVRTDCGTDRMRRGNLGHRERWCILN